MENTRTDYADMGKILREPSIHILGEKAHRLFRTTGGTILDLFWPYGTYIGPYLSLSVRTCVCICHLVTDSCPFYIPHILRPIYPDSSGYLLSMDQVSMCICRPDIYGYLSTRYLWISGDQISMSICDFFCQKGKQLLNCWSLFLSLYFFRSHFLRFMEFYDLHQLL